MPQYFSRSANTFARFSILGLVSGLAIVLCLSYLIVRSPYETMQNIPREQPVPFSHEHHVGGLGIDCRYCHTTVERASFANIPATKICMNCHSQMWATSPMLEPVRESYRTGKSIEWAAKWHQFDPAGPHSARSSARSVFGKPVHTYYNLAGADIVLALDADFLACGPGSTRYAREFADRRRRGDRLDMNRLYAVESTMTATGGKADHRLAMRYPRGRNVCP